VAFGVLTLLPLLAARPLRRIERNAVVAALAVGALAFAVVAGLVPTYSEAAPQRVNVDFVDDHVSGKAEWAIETGARLPQAFRKFHDPSFSNESRPISPLLRQAAYTMPAGATRFATPTVAVSAVPGAANRTITLTFQGSPSADRMVVVVPRDEGLLSAEIDGHVFLPAARSANPIGTIIACVTADCRGKSVKLVFWWRHPVHLTVGEQHFGLPQDGAKFQAARPPDTVASQSGDSTIAFANLTLR